MVKYISLITSIFCFLATGCNDRSGNNLMPELATCDSATVMYYHEKGNPRFFKMVKIHDKKIIVTIAENINDELVARKDSCVTQGKIHCYGKGDAVYTVYFTGEPDCRTMSFIRTGEKYFVQMNDDCKKILEDLRQVAKAPVSDN